MSETTNYNLFLTDNDSMKFITWRNKINGQTDSNMIKIDTALGEKADRSIAVYAKLTVNEWVGENCPFTQKIAIEELKAVHNGTVSLSHQATAEERTSAREAMLEVTGQEDGYLEISSYGIKPETNIPIVVILFG